MTYETEAVIGEIMKGEADRTFCRLKAVAGSSAVEISGRKYLVGHVRNAKAMPRRGYLWPLEPDGMTSDPPFNIVGGLEQFALTGWQRQGNVRLEIEGTSITKITLL